VHRLLAIAALAPLCACAAERKLVILSEPPGALVRLDDAIVGTTPYELRFDAYGKRRVTLYKQGYRTATQLVDLDTPWFAIFPLDLVSEVLIPIGWKDIRTVDVALVPEGGQVTMPDLKPVLERAESLRLAEPSGPRPSTRPAPAQPPAKPD
jgi:hypothetical protein